MLTGVQGLAFLHQEGVLHLDVKPDNIYRSHGILKLGDFGLAVLRQQWVSRVAVFSTTLTFPAWLHESRG